MAATAAPAPPLKALPEPKELAQLPASERRIQLNSAIDHLVRVGAWPAVEDFLRQAGATERLGEARAGFRSHHLTETSLHLDEAQRRIRSALGARAVHRCALRTAMKEADQAAQDALKHIIWLQSLDDKPAGVLKMIRDLLEYFVACKPKPSWRRRLAFGIAKQLFNRKVLATR